MAPRIPRSTYRIQLNPEFNFADAERIIPYLSRLGIGDIYASPMLAARSGSQHGYDVADGSRVSRDLGGDRGLRSLSASLTSHGMGLLLDIVPNHMAASTDNPWWSDLLENGRDSRYARYFDIDWHPTTGKGTLEDKVLLPVLGQIYGAALQAGEIQVHVTESGFVVRYYELELPVSTRSYPRILEGLSEQEGENDNSETLRRLITRLGENRSESLSNTVRLGEIFSLLWQLYSGSPRIKVFVDDRLRIVNGEKDKSDSHNLLASILDEQAYRLAYWRRAADEINYRRFFDITDLVGVRVEEEEVFRERHQLIMRFISEGLITGLRIDHVDGLYDPVKYLRELQGACLSASGAQQSQPVDDSSFYVALEKILVGHERLPERFEASGTTGYDFLNAINNLLIDRDGLATLDDFYERFTGVTQAFDEIAYERKKQVLDDLFWGDIRRLGDELIRLATTDRFARDVRTRQLSRALFEVTARMPVYRTYMNGEVSRQDRACIEHALHLARQTPFLSPAALDFLEHVLLLEPPDYAPEQKEAYREFVMRWQQFTGRAMAKGVEDTAFYVYNRLISMNEVGGEPSIAIAKDSEDFHRFNGFISRSWPHTMLATSTHDTKRSEDIRARIDVLSEIPEEWSVAVRRWSRLNAHLRQNVSGRLAPTPNEEYLLYQTLIGVWPLNKQDLATLPDRLEGFVIKALREAKTYTSWTRPDEEYERAVITFARSLVSKGNGTFLRSFLPLQERVAHFGALNSLAQLTLKLTSPGVPDFYQGTELWDFSLVDPDNRRSVDFVRREALLQELESRGKGRRYAKKLLDRWIDGRVKMLVTHRGLQLRQQEQSLFESGRYQPIVVAGPHKRHVCAFAREHHGRFSLTVVPRVSASLVKPFRFPVGRIWKDTRLNLPAGFPRRWRELFTGGELSLPKRGSSLAIADVLADFPVAVLVAQ